MKAVIQRVTKASVSINNIIKSDIAVGLLILLGIENQDNNDDVLWLTNKIANLRIFDDNNGIMNISLLDIGGDALVVSQFTLHAKTKKGNRPSYIHAASPEIAIPLYEQFISVLENQMKKKIKTGKFGAMMEISLTNSGPVTIIIDTKNKV